MADLFWKPTQSVLADPASFILSLAAALGPTPSSSFAAWAADLKGEEVGSWLAVTGGVGDVSREVNVCEVNTQVRLCCDVDECSVVPLFVCSGCDRGQERRQGLRTRVWSLRPAADEPVGAGVRD